MRFVLAIFLATFVTVALAGRLTAGPWPREEGKSFLSVSTSFSWPQDALGHDQWRYSSVYYEYGLRRRLTFGLDAGSNADGNYAAFVFLRTPILESAKPHLFSLRAGLGATGGGAGHDTVVMAGAAWGRGFESRFGGGWATLDLQAHYLVDAGELIVKADATVGVKPTDKWKVMMQVQSGSYPNNDPFLRLAPSVAWSWAPGRHLEIGGQIGLVNDDRVGLKIGTWFEF